MIEVADRLKQVEEYYFSKKLREVNFLKSQGRPIINLGIGSPDLDPPFKANVALEESLNDDGAHKYQNYQGLPELREAMANFYHENFKVHLSAQTEILPLMGSKEGIMHISMAFLNKGDKILAPNPGYPTYSAVAGLLDAQTVYYDLEEDNNWLPNFTALEKMDLERVKIMWVNYPHMPTGANAPHKFFDEIIAFGKRHSILIVNDNPYSFILNNNPKSILRYNNAKEVCLELNSLSKTFNMAGWRVGMVCGNYEFIQAVLQVKSNMDSGMFYGIQKGAIEALNSSEMWFVSLNSVYEKRRQLIWDLATKLNCTYDEDASGLFVWAKLPPHFNSVEFADLLLKEHSIFVAPGSVFGSLGEGYIRFSLCSGEVQIEEALARIK